MEYSSSSTLHWESIEIPVKWGNLRGKRLRNGSSNVSNKMSPTVNVLGIHGWLDNCNSFDRLVSFFPSYINFVALDLPGHGYSDHLPYGAKYDLITYAYSIKDAVEYLQWDSFIYLGHSMGSSVGHILIGIFPKLMKAFISIDYIGYRGVIGHPLTDNAIWEDAFEFYQIENLSSLPPLYTKAEALNRFINSRVNMKSNLPFIDESAAKSLIERAMKPVLNKEGFFTWSHDQRAKKRWTSIFRQDMMYDLVSSMECPILIIKAYDGVYKGFDKTELNESNLVSAYSKKCKLFQLVKVPGNHYPHFQNAIEVSNVIFAFIEKIVFASKL